VNATGWRKGLQVTAGGTGIVSDAGVALVRALAGSTGLTAGLSAALASDRLLARDRGRVLAGLACAIAGGAEVIGGFPVMGGQEGLFGLVAWVPAAWRALAEIARGGDRALGRTGAAVNAARRRAWAGIGARHGAIPGIRVAGKMLDGVTCIGLDAGVVAWHGGEEGAGPDFEGSGVHPLLACDNTGEPLAGMLGPGWAGSSTPAGHLAVLDAAVTAVPPRLRRRLMVACDGAGASHGLIARLDALAARPGYQLICSAGRELGGRERAAIGAVPARAWQIAAGARGQARERRAGEACGDLGCGHRRCRIEEAHVTGLTSLLREGPAGDQMGGWPEPMRVFARRGRPRPGARLTLSEAGDGWRYRLRVTSRPAATKGWPGHNACIDAARRVHARAEDAVRTGNDCGTGKYPSTSPAMNTAWQAAALTAAALPARLRLLALDGDLARAEPKTLRYRIWHAAARLARGGRRRRLRIQASRPWPDGIMTARDTISALPQAP